MHTRVGVVGGVCLLSAGLLAHSEAITYTESAVVSGSLNGTSFTDKQLTITGTADTGSIVNEGGGLFQLNIPLNGTVAGVGSFTLSGDSIFSSEPGDIGGVVMGSNVILDTFNLGFDPYNLGGPIGPLTGTAGFASTIATSAGTLDITGSGESTFDAVVATTPEPSGIILLGTGLLGLARMVRRRLGDG